jgi:hypothetical protein
VRAFVIDESEDASLAGKTVNERLFHLGIVTEWDEAVRRQERAAMLHLLELAEVSEPQFTVDATLAAAPKYRY